MTTKIPEIVLNTEEKIVAKKKNLRRGRRLILNLHYTQYPGVKIVARRLNFRVRNDDLNILALQGYDGK